MPAVARQRGVRPLTPPLGGGGKARRGRAGSPETCLRPQPHKPSWKGVGSMLTSRRTYLTLLVASLALCLFAPAALAGTPAPVTVRAEGLSDTLPPAPPRTTT